MENNIAISVADLFSSTLHTRHAASELFQAIPPDPCDTVNLDFVGVDYISRSFADQFCTEMSAITKNGQKNITLTNANEVVAMMLRSVAKTQDEDKRNYEKIPEYNYTDWSSLERFLLSV